MSAQLRIFLAGATGVIGIRLIPLLVREGHTVAGMTRTAAKASELRRLGAVPVICDALDAAAVREAVVGFGPELIIDQLTDLPDERARISEFSMGNNRIRREGIVNLLAAARVSGGPRVFSQSVAFPLEGDGQAAVEDQERQVLEADGVVLRYGQLYGSGTFYEVEPPPPPRVQIDVAVRRTIAALDSPDRAVLTIVD